MFPGSHVPMVPHVHSVLCGESPMFLMSYVPVVLCYQGTMVLCSWGPRFPISTYVLSTRSQALGFKLFGKLMGVDQHWTGDHGDVDTLQMTTWAVTAIIKFSKLPVKVLLVTSHSLGTCFFSICSLRKSVCGHMAHAVTVKTIRVHECVSFCLCQIRTHSTVSGYVILASGFLSFSAVRRLKRKRQR